ncbi:MAG: hypothetical protein VKP70_04410 [Cyanobacteriota bacterium]|nr:hypothetical protein [Cyanobacteriota bacterium]
MTAASSRQVHGMAPLIRFTLLALYVALVAPLPVMASGDLRRLLWAGGLVGLLLLVALTSERVVVDEDGIEVSHPAWCAWCLRRGWQLAWSQVAGLTPVATSQGGRVYYVRAKGASNPETPGAPRSYLLPQRVERFEDFLARFSALSGVSTEGVSRISPPWTYQVLALMTSLLLVGEAAALAWPR